MVSTDNMPADAPRIRERLETLDLLRGVALLGVMLMNIPEMGGPTTTYHPPFPMSWHSPDWLTFLFEQMTVEGSARGLFNLLFGAGVLLITSRNGVFDRPIQTADVFFRRCLGLVALGVVNIVLLLWFGDILFFYGIAGMFVFAFRKLGPRWLLALALAVIALQSVPDLLTGRAEVRSLHDLPVAEARQARHLPLSDAQQAALDQHAEALKWNNPTPAMQAPEVQARSRHDYPGLIGWNLDTWLSFQMSGFRPFVTFGEAAGAMLLGMALFKWGILSGERSRGFYVLLMIAGYGVGWASRYVVLKSQLDHNFMPANDWYPLTYELHRITVTLGHIGLILLVWKMNLWGWLGRGFEALGRMALTNYLTQSVLGAVIFYGLGWFHHLSFAQLAGMGALIIAAQMIFSTIWLKFHAFGPVEWLLRGVSYGRLQPWWQARA
ncbi:MAG: DUF418 domain-containing protein [Asticcacaulis sp.]